MAATISIYNHVPKLILNKEINFTTIKTELLSNSASYDGTHTTKRQVDNAVAVATVTTPVASPGVVNWTGHTFAANQPVLLKTTGALPTGLSPDTWYYVIAAGLTTNAFEVAATPGGAAINFTGATSGVHSGYASGTYEVYGNNWPAGGPLLASVTATQAAISDATSNDAKLAATDVSVTAAGGSIGPAYKALLYDATTMFPLAYIDFGAVQTAGDTTDFKIRWNANGILNIIM